jgi:hypothetical protein
VICSPCVNWPVNELEQRFSNFFSSGDHFYQSKCSTNHPTLVPFESKFIIFVNVLSLCQYRHTDIFKIVLTFRNRAS